MQKINCRWPWLFLAFLVVVLDWLSKQWVLVHTIWGQVVRITSFFNIRLVYNRGMAFGFLNEHTGWQSIFLTFIALGAVIVLSVWLFRAKNPTFFFLCALPLIIGGAIGNALDRVMNRQVTDFLDFHAFGWHFWTFNLADAAITVGVVLLLLDYVLTEKNNA
jgi:signal peptidase II